MVFLEKFNLLSAYKEQLAMERDRRRIYNNVYPFHIFTECGLENIDFDSITCFYGGNGSGKSTLLNIIASKLNATRLNPLEKGGLFDLYVSECDAMMNYLNSPSEIKAITSDDVFDYLLDIRSINSTVHRRKEELSQEYLNNKYANRDESIEEYIKIRDKVEAGSKTMSQYVRQRLVNNNIIEQSNGESALFFWEREIKDNSIYILDEPENSLSAENQIKLKKFIEESVRFYNCQFIISTHSPFLLSLMDAKIYDLDNRPCRVKNWTLLPNVRLYYDFFKEHDEEFKNLED